MTENTRLSPEGGSVLKSPNENKQTKRFTKRDVTDLHNGNMYHPVQSPLDDRILTE